MNKKKILLVGVLFILPLFGMLFIVTPKVSAATITVDTTADENSEPAAGTGCSLFEAIEATRDDSAYGGCSAGSGDDTISLPAGTYSIAANPLNELRDSTSLVGDEDGGTIITGGTLLVGANLSNQTYLLQDITVQNSSDAGISIIGGGENYVITLNRVTVTDSSSTGITHTRYSYVSTGRLNITNSLIQNNGSFGFYNNECQGVGSAYITNSMIMGNSDAGVINTCGLTVLNRVTIANNTSTDYAGGIHVDGGSGASRVEMTNTTVYNNTSINGIGGVGGVSGAELLMTNATIANNTGASIGGVAADGSMEAYNTLVTNNTAANCDISVALESGSTNNMSSDESCPESFTVTFNTDVADTLSDDGGTASIGSGGLEGNVLTLALLEGSPAIDAGSNDYCPAIDERDANRPNGDTCDIGAYESPFGVTTSTPDDSEEESSDPNSLADTGQNPTIIVGAAVLFVALGGLGFVKSRQHY